MSRLRPPRPRPATTDEPIARAVRNLLWARTVRAEQPARPTTMRATLSFLTSTSSTAGEWPTSVAHTLEPLGWDPAARRLYFVEHGAASDVLLVMATAGEHGGTLLPLSGDRARITRLRGELVPLASSNILRWELGTRVVQRRGLKIATLATPVRKFALGLSVVQRVGGTAAAFGRATVTAYLRPRAALDSAWVVPGESLGVALISYCGVPAGVGFDKQTAVLAAPQLQ